MFKKIGIVLLLVMLGSACEPSKPKQGGGKFGMLEANIPESAAIQFFEHIYHSKNLDGAIELSTPKMERLLRSYHTNKGVQNHVFNMRFDKVAIQPSTRRAGRNEFAEQSTVSLFFEGELHGNIFKDMRNVKLIKIKNDWKVDSVSLN